MDPKLQAAVLTIARQRDWERANAHRWPVLADVTRARIAAHDHDLAALAGAWSYVDAAALVDAARSTPEPYGLASAELWDRAPRTSALIQRLADAAGPDDDEDDDEDEAHPQLDSVEAWDAHAAVLDGYRQAELDTQAEPMGGWEPRS